jgi:hypothetical protein
MADEPAPNTPATPTTPTSFADFIDQKLSGVELSDAPAADDKKEAAPEGKKEGDAPLDDKTPVVPPASAVVPEDKKEPDPDADEAAEDQRLDDLFKTKAGDAFRELKTELKSTRKQFAEERTRLTAELEAAKKAGAAVEEVERLRAELADHKKVAAEYEAELALTRVEATRVYKEQVAKPLAAVKSTLAEIAKVANIKVADIQSALDEADPAEQEKLLGEIGANLTERQRFTLYNLVPQYRGLIEQEKFVRENAREALAIIEQRSQQETTAAKEAETAEYLKALDTSWGQIQEKVPFLRKIDGQAEWNATLDKLQTTGKAIDVSVLPAPDRAQLIYQAQAFPLAVNAVNHYANEVVRLQKLVEKYEKGKPGGGTGDPVVPDTKKPVTAGGFLEAVGAK